MGVEPHVRTPDATTGVTEVSAAEATLSARVGGTLFRYRGWLPLLFLAIPLLAPGDTSLMSWVVGGFLIVGGELWRLAGVAVAGTTTRRRSRNVQKLVTHGVFGWSRNPLYNGNFLVWMGFVAISGVLWFLPAAVLLFAAEYSLIVRYEEGVLETTFGRVYLDYKRCTPRWIPSTPGVPAVGDVNWREAWRSEISTFLQYAVLIVAFVLKERLSG